ncbi:Phospholipase D [Ephemeroptericola cinctiostellae]|uniref:phospholipase D n=1 Tax=Ephemeroptericola cinctiostellae TaxID=2268024 RepID=A0A345D9R1_9BURK|nr:phospholipase D-like domain-containing protein [Ephemeroptericola cinctiostellae]AXF85099.1 Phospholipase D [Ephemeroptericola cinctiostellae]
MLLRRTLTCLTLIAVGYAMGAYVMAWDALAKSPSLTTQTTASSKANSAAQIKVLFSPNDDVQGEIVSALNAAKKQILVQAYLLTDDSITHALMAAHQRKVDVRVLLDAVRTQQASGSDANALSHAGINVKLENRYENAHNKVIVIDAGLPSAVLLTGSYNFTYTAAKKNAENLLMIRNAPDVVTRYVNNWMAHDKEAIPYVPAP